MFKLEGKKNTRNEVLEQRVGDKVVNVGLYYGFDVGFCVFSYITRIEGKLVMYFEKHDEEISPIDFLDELEEHRADLLISTNNPYLFDSLNYYEENIELFDTVELLQENYERFDDFAHRNKIALISKFNAELNRKTYKYISLAFGTFTDITEVNNSLEAI